MPPTVPATTPDATAATPDADPALQQVVEEMAQLIRDDDRRTLVSRWRLGRCVEKLLSNHPRQAPSLRALSRALNRHTGGWNSYPLLLKARRFYQAVPEHQLEALSERGACFEQLLALTVQTLPQRQRRELLDQVQRGQPADPGGLAAGDVVAVAARGAGGQGADDLHRPALRNSFCEQFSARGRTAGREGQGY